MTLLDKGIPLDFINFTEGGYKDRKRKYFFMVEDFKDLVKVEFKSDRLIITRYGKAEGDDDDDDVITISRGDFLKKIANREFRQIAVVSKDPNQLKKEHVSPGFIFEMEEGVVWNWCIVVSAKTTDEKGGIVRFLGETMLYMKANLMFNCGDLKDCKKCGVTRETSSEMKRCSRCKGVWYCSEKCHREDWGSHKPDCEEIPEVELIEKKEVGEPVE